jgi:hypothetical protein
MQLARMIHGQQEEFQGCNRFIDRQETINNLQGFRSYLSKRLCNKALLLFLSLRRLMAWCWPAQIRVLMEIQVTEGSELSDREESYWLNP